MSSGPSLRNEKPRDASSICGELMPRSSSAPSTCAMSSASRTGVDFGEPCPAERETRIVDRCAQRPRRPGRGRWRPGARVHPVARAAHARGRRGRTFRRRTRRSAGARPARDRFFEENGNVAAIGHQSEKPSSSGGSPSAGNAIALRGLRLPRGLVPQLELAALPDEHDVLVERGVATQRRAEPGCDLPHRSRRRRRDRPAAAAGRACARRTTKGSSAGPGSAPTRRADRAAGSGSGSAVMTMLRATVGQRVAVASRESPAGPWRRGRAARSRESSPWRRRPPRQSAPPPTPPLLLAHRPIHST